MLAVRVRAPVIPVVIKGSAKAWPHGRFWPGPARVTVQIGTPIVPEGGRGREPVIRLLQRIEVELREMSAMVEAR